MAQTSVKFEFFTHRFQLFQEGIVDHDIFFRDSSAHTADKIIFGKGELRAGFCSKDIQLVTVAGGKRNVYLICSCKLLNVFDLFAEIIQIFR